VVENLYFVVIQQCRGLWSALFNLLQPEMFNFLFSKPHENVTPRDIILAFNMHQIICRLGLRPRPNWGSLQRSSRHPSCI